MSATSVTSALAQEKQRLRARALALRQSIAPAERVRLSEVAAVQGVALALACNAGAASLYWPIRDEPDVLPLLSALQACGVVTALPVTGARGQPLVFRQWRAGDPQVIGPMRIPEPASHLPIIEPDLLFLPLTVFDLRGNRIGYGAGYYDMTLQRLRAKKRVTAVGVAFAALAVPAVPAEAHDQRLDYILTENGLMACAE